MAENNTQVIAQNNTAVTEAKSNNKITDYSLGIFGTSDNFIMAMQMAKALAESTVVPNIYHGNPSNCLIAIEQAQRLNVSPLMVMQNLYVIQGRPSWSSKFLIAAINNSGKYDMELQFEEIKDKNGKPFSCTAWTTKDGRRIEGMTVDMDMAQAEGWLTKNGSKWKTMPQLMLRYRAASFFSSLNCPELTLGLYTSEEVRDMGSEADFIQQEVVNPFEQKAIGEEATEVEEVSNPFETSVEKKVEEEDSKRRKKSRKSEPIDGEQMTLEAEQQEVSDEK